MPLPTIPLQPVRLPEMQPRPGGFMGLSSMFPQIRLPDFGPVGPRFPSFGRPPASFSGGAGPSSFFPSSFPAIQPGPGYGTNIGTGSNAGSNAGSKPSDNSGLPAAQQLSGEPKKFVDTLRPLAEKVAAETGVPTELILAVAANETGYGRAPTSLFGIKALPGQPAIHAGTWEEENGQRVNTSASFRAYGSTEEAIRDFARLVSSGRYRPAYDEFQSRKNVGDYARALQRAGYATDSQWGDKIERIAATLPMGDGSWLSVAKTKLGERYVWGGKDPATGFDCSGFAGWVGQQKGDGTTPVESTLTLYRKSQAIGGNELQPGDYVFYNMGETDMTAQHVAIYIGNGQVIQSGGTQRSVNIAPVNQWGSASPPEFRRILR
jgi:cell wall-associated NlpC family hydrolase